MFGYVLPIQRELTDEEFVLYRSFYCGICLAIKNRLGEIARLTTSYDMTFFAILLSDIVGQHVDFRQCRCIANPIRKKVVVDQNYLMDRIADTSVILAYHKTRDDIADKSKLKGRIAGRLIGRAYKRAVAASPEIEQIVEEGLQQLSQLQKDNVVSLDRLAHPFADIIKNLAAHIIGDKTNDNVKQLCYNVGKFVYLIDSLDDFGEDVRCDDFNAFLQVARQWDEEQGLCTVDKYTKAVLVRRHMQRIEFAVHSTINRAIEAFNSLLFSQSYAVLKNIVHKGLRYKFAQVLVATEKLTSRQIHKDMLRKKTKASKAVDMSDVAESTKVEE